MITLPGRLTVKTIQGRNGPFNVGRLATSIGEFVIKDSQLEQFSEGQFSGEFLVMEIKPASYFAGGRLVVEIRAHVGEMILTNNGVLTTNASPHFDSSELDPLEEEVRPQPPSTPAPSPTPVESPAEQPFGQAPAPQEVPQVPPVPQESLAAGVTDSELFGMVWPLGNSVKLDSTVDRALLRRQAARLNELGYQFQSRTQTWLK